MALAMLLFTRACICPDIDPMQAVMCVLPVSRPVTCKVGMLHGIHDTTLPLVMQFVAGLGRGGASLVWHVSGWSLASVAGFSAAASRALQRSLAARRADL